MCIMSLSVCLLLDVCCWIRRMLERAPDCVVTAGFMGWRRLARCSPITVNLPTAIPAGTHRYTHTHTHRGKHKADSRQWVAVTYQPNNVEPEVILSLDAQKAFDRIEYNYLIATLERFGFSATFCSWIKILYTAPQASVRTNKTISDYFPLSWGTRQGCPLSPQLFDIAIEPLAILLRETTNLAGVQRAGHLHKVSLYVDNLVLFLSDPYQLHLSSSPSWGKFQDIC